MLNRRLATTIVLWFTAIGGLVHSTHAAEGDRKPAAGPPPTAAEAKVRIWTAILVDGATGKPLENFEVEVKIWKAGHREQQPIVFTSGSGGEVKIPLAAGTSTYFVPKDGKWLAQGWTVVGEVSDEFHFWTDPLNQAKPEVRDPSKPVTIKFAKGTEVRGQLLLPDGAPAAGVDLSIGAYVARGDWGVYLPPGNWHRGQWPNWNTSAVTKDDGSFTAVVPPPSARTYFRIGTIDGGFSAIKANPEHRKPLNRALFDYAPFEFEVAGDAAKESPDLLDVGKLQLKNGTTLKGRVVDAEGKPLPGIGLYTSSNRGPYAGRFTESTADGSFEFLPLNPGKITLSPEARLKDEKGEVNSRDVRAVFIPQEVTIAAGEKTIELKVQALPHVTLEFEWIDRRAKKGPVAYYGCFSVSGRVNLPGQKPTWWSGETEKITRDGKEILFVKVPTLLEDATFQHSRDDVVIASYEAGSDVSGPEQIKLGDITKPRRRIIYGDEPKGEEK